MQPKPVYRSVVVACHAYSIPGITALPHTQCAKNALATSYLLSGSVGVCVCVQFHNANIIIVVGFLRAFRCDTNSVITASVCVPQTVQKTSSYARAGLLAGPSGFANVMQETCSMRADGQRAESFVESSIPSSHRYTNPINTSNSVVVVAAQADNALGVRYGGLHCSGGGATCTRHGQH